MTKCEIYFLETALVLVCTFYYTVTAISEASMFNSRKPAMT